MDTKSFLEIEKIKEYTWFERLKYTYKRKFFCKFYFMNLLKLPYVASNRDIHIDFLWRDLQIKNKKNNEHFSKRT